jgi:hypothetical protein
MAREKKSQEFIIVVRRTLCKQRKKSLMKFNLDERVNAENNHKKLTFSA